MIKAVIFDVDGVLLDSFEANFKFFQNLMYHTGHPLPTREDFSGLFHMTMWDAIKHLTDLSDEQDIQKIWEVAKSREVAYPIELLAIPDGAEPVIRTLQKTYTLGIVTSRIRESVFEAPALAKLKDCFKVVVSYTDTQNHKPHPEPLILATQKLGVLPEECVYIGDAATDVQAAHTAGMKIIGYSKLHLPAQMQLPQIILKFLN